jgi:hypothetical protein
LIQSKTVSFMEAPEICCHGERRDAGDTVEVAAGRCPDCLRNSSAAVPPMSDQSSGIVKIRQVTGFVVSSDQRQPDKSSCRAPER